MTQPLLVISPHYDDAVLSAGQLLAGARVPVLVATMCTEPPHDGSVLTGWDQSSGFKSASEAVRVRAAEDACALAWFRQVHQVPLGFIDCQYGHGHSIREVALAIQGIIGDRLPEIVVGPLGINHPDHVDASDATLMAASWTMPRAYLYEELPHRVKDPEAARRRVDHLRERGYTMELVTLDQGDKALKRAALLQYGSQQFALDLDCCFVPERFWKVEWCAS